jgi:hypothetical protein
MASPLVAAIPNALVGTIAAFASDGVEKSELTGQSAKGGGRPSGSDRSIDEVSAASHAFQKDLPAFNKAMVELFGR